MRAVAVREFRAPPEVMTVDVPEPAAGEVAVRMEAAGVNPFDWKIADGVLDGRRPHRFPLVLGVDGAGVVTSVGRSAGRFRVGDRLFGQFLHDPVGIGTYAEVATVPTGIGIAPTPESWSSVEAAAVPTAGMTALAALERAGVGPGGTLAIVGATGGIGTFATALAVAQGVHVLAAVRPEVVDRARGLGAEWVVPLGTDEAVERARALRPNGCDALLDVMDPREAFLRWAGLVRPGGVALSSIYAAPPNAPDGPRARLVNLDLQPSSELLDRLVTRLRSSRVRIPVERTIPLEAAPAALAESRTGRLRGKTVIALGR